MMSPILGGVGAFLEVAEVAVAEYEDSGEIVLRPTGAQLEKMTRACCALLVSQAEAAAPSRTGPAARPVLPEAP
jgi:hypothetical protein